MSNLKGERSNLSLTQSEFKEVPHRWIELQEEGSKNIVQQDTESWQEDLTELKLVAGVDISYPVTQNDPTGEHSNKAVACVTICSMPDLKLIENVVHEIEFQEPYIPGFLAFRESEPLVKLLKNFVSREEHRKPDVILVDGNGLLHPRRYGLACDIGLQLNTPTIGVAKNLYRMETVEYEKSSNVNLLNAGDLNYIRDDEGILGMALKTTKDCKNPVYVSVGHKISLDTAMKVVMGCCKYRVPEPIRFADFFSREFLRSQATEHGVRSQKESESSVG